MSSSAKKLFLDILGLGGKPCFTKASDVSVCLRVEGFPREEVTTLFEVKGIWFRFDYFLDFMGGSGAGRAFRLGTEEVILRLT
jgi:hypothetical protein